MTAPDIAIEVEGLSKSFGGRAVVHDLSMQVKRGTIYGFLGPNGSGKTTTIRMLCGLLTPDKGRGTCLGYDILTETDKIKLQVGYMTQRFSLYQDLSVRENLEFVARLYAVPDPVGAARAMVERLGLKGREEQLAGSLSGGWKQRLALGACTLPNPQLLLLDEPTAGVDPKARREFWNEIHALAAEGLTVLVSTHYMDEAERCHEIAYIAYGDLLVHGTVAGGDRAVGPHDLHGRAARDSASSPRSWKRRRASTWWRRSAPACMCRAATRRRSKPRSRPIASDPRLHWERSEPSLEDVFIDLMGRARDNFQEDEHRRQHGVARLLAAHARDADQGIHPAPPRPRVVRHDHHDPADAAHAVRLCHQHHAARPADRGAAAGDERCRPLDPRGAAEHALFQGHASGRAQRGRVRPAARLRHGAVRCGNSGELRARAAARRPAGAAGRGRRDRSGRGGLGARRARHDRDDRAAQRSRASRTPPRRRSRSARMRATIRRPRPRSTSCRAWSAPSSP